MRAVTFCGESENTEKDMKSVTYKKLVKFGGTSDRAANNLLGMFYFF
jgi:hypothetical protein